MISFVICSINAERFSTIKAHFRELMGAEPYEVVGVHDAKSLCEGYTRGMAAAKGEILVFCHDDIEIWTPEFAPRLKGHLQHFDVIGVAGTNLLVGPGWYQAGPPYSFGQVAHLIPGGFHVSIYGALRRVMPGIQALDGLFMAFRRAAIERVGWDAVTFDGFHCYDVDCSYRAYKMGLKLGVAMDLPMLHMSHGNFGEAWKVYAERFMAKHSAGGGALASISPRQYQWAAVQVPTKPEAVEVMRAVWEGTV